MQNLFQRVIFLWKFYVLRVVLPGVLPRFVMFLELLCLKDPLNCTCLGVKLLHHYLFRVCFLNTCLG